MHLIGRLLQEWWQEPVRLLRVQRHLLVGRERGAAARRRRDADLSGHETDHRARRLLVRARLVRDHYHRRPHRRREPGYRRRAALESPLQRHRQHHDSERAAGERPTEPRQLQNLQWPDRRRALRFDRRRSRLRFRPWRGEEAVAEDEAATRRTEMVTSRASTPARRVSTSMQTPARTAMPRAWMPATPARAWISTRPSCYRSPSMTLRTR